MSAPNPPTGHDDTAEALSAAYAKLDEIARRAKAADPDPDPQPDEDDGASTEAA